MIKGKYAIDIQDIETGRQTDGERFRVKNNRVSKQVWQYFNFLMAVY